MNFRKKKGGGDWKRAQKCLRIVKSAIYKYEMLKSVHLFTLTYFILVDAIKSHIE